MFRGSAAVQVGERQDSPLVKGRDPSDRTEFRVARPALSIVMPTRNEAGNIEHLVGRLEQVLPNTTLEIIFVDDSDDETVRVIERVRESSRSNIKLIHRPPDQRNDGLGGAVVTGLHAARAPWICVMDADLQHPPELVPELLARAAHADVDLVLASRYSNQGSARGLNRRRTIVSHAATSAAHGLFPGQLRGVSDPLSGFFLVRRDAIDPDQLKPQGFKILLEILVRTPSLRVAEVGFEFGTRHAGESKASFREGMRYLSHLGRLRLGEETLRFIQFLIVGATGLLVNSLLLAFATDILGLYYLVSAVIATQGSTLWNFALTEYWVFADREQRQGRTARLLMFLLMNNGALLLRGPMIYVLTSGLGVYYLVSNIISLVSLTVLRYAIADRLIWRRPRRTAQYSLHHYNIHGLVTITSEVWLPELERFRVEMVSDRPTIRVRVGAVEHTTIGPAHAGASQHIQYDEGIGAMGFGINVKKGETIDVLASPILQWSPHVLYTNVVEPILRWTFVEKGYALVHGACIAFGEEAFLVTARTDTGKTTTVLRILDRQRRATDQGAFLSDDLTLVSPDGHVLTYPKPLTISYHTVAAINSPLLSFRERLGLIVQSRLHSRKGRRFALWLARTRLPVATINTLVQWLVPPPKYHIQRLVPHVKLTSEARLAGLFVIERGGEGDIPLGDDEGLEILMSNCEDAYGFPPYPAIAGFLHGSNERNLRAIEREIVAGALRGRSALLLRSTTMDWSQRIATLVNATGTSRTQRGLSAVGTEISAGLSPA